MPVYCNGHFSLYLRNIIFQMKIFVNSIFLTFLFFGYNVFGQSCLDKYEITKLTHIDCYGDNTGEINIILTNNNSTHLWTFPDLVTTSNSYDLTNLYAGSYVLEIIELGDTCRDTIIIEETIQINADISINNLCDVMDSGHVSIQNIWGGTPPYSVYWLSTGLTGMSVQLPPGDHTVRFRDANDCSRWITITVTPKVLMSAYMQATHADCKDDNTGSARVFITGGDPPFYFQWDIDSSVIIEDNSSSIITDLLPGYYSVKVTDSQGCYLIDSIEVKTNPKTCLKIYNVFTPNGDQYHSYWHLERIELYPEALIEIYDHSGNMIFRRRNYQNSEQFGFSGRDKENKKLPSGTYYYIVNLENEDTIFRGTVTILR